MIQQLSQVAEVQNRLQNSTSAKQFNASLPVSLEVMERTHSMRYMLKVGNTALETKSLKELQIGMKYWAHMGKSSAGSILLSNLIPQPALWSNLSKSAWRLSSKEMESLLDSSGANPWDKLRALLGERLSMAENRGEFLFLGNLLLSLQQKVLTLPLRYENEKDSLLQMRSKRSRGGITELEFYSIFVNLGAIKGKIFEPEEGEGAHLYLWTLYASTAALLEGELEELQGIKKTTIAVDEGIAPLYEAGDSLLNLKG